MINRYAIGSGFPQPIRKIKKAPTDVIHPFKMGERLDNLSQKYYQDPTLSWIIMCANPQYFNELSIAYGDTVRIPMPLSRVMAAWNIDNEI